MKDFHEQTYYELLDIPANASQEEILKAYNRARSTYGNNSPALYSLFNKEEAQELLKLIDEAYNVLSNPFKRKQYDKDSKPGDASHQTAHPEGDLAIPSTADIPFFTGDELTQDAIPTGGSSGSAMPSIKETAQATVPPLPLSKHSVVPPQNATGVISTTHDQAPARAESSGLGSTIFSRYKIDEAMEKEIKVAEIYSGNLLHKIRMYKNVTLDQISEITKVSRAYLVALENDNYSSLPAQVFIRGFLVQISKILNLDAGRVTNSYLKLMKEKLKK